MAKPTATHADPSITAAVAGGARLGPVARLLLMLALTMLVAGAVTVILLFQIASTDSFHGSALSIPQITLHSPDQLSGWMGLILFAVAAHLLGQAARPRPRRWVGVAGRVLLTVGLVAAMATLLPWPADDVGFVQLIAGAILLPAAFLLVVEFLWSLAGASLDVFHLFLLAAIQWLLVWTSANLVLTYQNHLAPEMAPASRTLLTHLALLGFVTNMLFAFGIRLLPGLLGVGRMRPRAFLLGGILYNAGFIGLLGGTSSVHWVGLVGSVAMLLGSLLYLAGLGFLRGAGAGAAKGELRTDGGATPVDAGTGERGRPGEAGAGGVLVRVAFGWLLAALVMLVGACLWRALVDPAFPVHPAYIGAERHALTVGFIATLILGAGFRLLHFFQKPYLAMPRLVFVSSGLMALGVAWRVATELLATRDYSWSYPAMGPSGILEFVAVLLFALALLRTLLAGRRRHVAGEPVTGATRLNEAMAADAGLSKALRPFNVSMDMLREAPASTTLGGLALGCAIPLDVFLATVNAPRPR